MDESDLGISWTLDEPLQRTSHALRDDEGRVWLVDPLDADGAVDRASALGTPAGVLQLLDRHGRDCATLASRLGIPHHRVPGRLDGTPFEVVGVLSVPGWREVALWWEARRALVVAEALGTTSAHTAGRAAAGVHPLLRPRPPRALARYEPLHLLMGHGESLHGAAAGPALEQAYARAWSDIPALLAQLPALVRGARSR